MSWETGTWTELLSSNRGDFTAHHTSAAEVSLLAGLNLQPVIPATFFKPISFGKAIRIEANGIFSTTGTPTLIFQLRLGTTVGATYLSGTSVGVSAAITTGSGVANVYWELWLRLICNTPGYGSTNCTLSGGGIVYSPGGFAAPYGYALEPTTPNTATWTSTIDGSLTQYVNVSATWSASSASNTITCKSCVVKGEN